MRLSDAMFEMVPCMEDSWCRLWDNPGLEDQIRKTDEHCIISKDLVPSEHSDYGFALLGAGQHKQALATFEAALVRKPDDNEIKKKYAYAKCHIKVKAALESTHRNLMQIFTTYDRYKEKLTLVKDLKSKISQNMMTKLQRLENKLIADFFKYGPLENANCKALKGTNNKLKMTCKTNDWKKYNETVFAEYMKQFSIEFYAKSKTPAVPKGDINPAYADQKPAANESKNRKLFYEHLKQYHKLDMSDYMIEMKLAKTPYKDDFIYYSEDSNQTTLNLIENIKCILKSEKEIYKTFAQGIGIVASPQKFSQIIPLVLSDYLNLNKTNHHPFPWSEPFCMREALSLKFKPESDVEHQLYEMAKLSPEYISLLELGQRIKTQQDNYIKPYWVVSNLAALYFRSRGKLGDALNCLKESIDNKNQDEDGFTLYQYFNIKRCQRGFLADFEEHTDYYKDLLDEMKSTHFLDLVDSNPYYEYLYNLVHLIAFRENSDFERIKNSARRAMLLDSTKHWSLIDESYKLLQKLECLSPTVQLKTSMKYFRQCCKNLDEIFCFWLNPSKYVKNNYVCINSKQEPYQACTGNNNTSIKLPAQFIFAYLILPSTKSVHNVDDKTLMVSDPISLAVLGAASKSIDKKIKAEESLLDINSKAAIEISLENGGFNQTKHYLNLDYALKESDKFHEVEINYPQKQENEDVSESSYQGTFKNTDGKEMPSLKGIKDRRDILNYDLKFQAKIPEPSKDQVKKGLNYFKLPTNEDNLNDFCYMHNSNPINFDQPISTWVSITAKGLNLEDYLDLNMIVPGISNLEPKCPSFVGENEEDTSKLIHDYLPAYNYRDQFYFYKPEKALTDTLRTLGNDKEKIEHVGARLTLAMRVSNMQEQVSGGEEFGVHWALTTASTLYWRVKGDSQNAIRCLRHSLKNAPANMRDVALINMANIYHQAGFLHSALYVGGRALEYSQDLTSIHFTLANIYASLGDNDRALKFYFSTIALQHNFAEAKARIRAIICQNRNLSFELIERLKMSI
uniref:TPR_REGION domain-containing protein n=1 Tax=Rhabditophanes sp. KR3021 TaxID=114890 RepID=A0AC35UAJ0_9BILA